MAGPPALGGGIPRGVLSGLPDVGIAGVPATVPVRAAPRAELIAKLKRLTNLRVVRDAESATGWKLTHDPFPGWETVPTW